MLSPSAFKPRRQNAPRPAWKVAEAYKQWVRGRRCACQGRNPDCGGDMQAAHVDGARKGSLDAKGMGTKAADRCCIPLSASCHGLQHSKGWPWFIANILAGKNPEGLSEDYWRAWPGRAAWEANRG